MLRSGVIMDVVDAEQARLAEEAGACAVMAVERVPADIRSGSGVARMPVPTLLKDIKRAVTVPVMAKVRIGHFVEAQILEAVGVDYVDESEVLAPADHRHHINKHNFRVPFVCGCGGLGEALRRIREGAAMIRTKGEACTGDVVEAVGQVRADAALMMQLGCDGVFVGSGIFKSADPARRARAIVQAVTHYSDPEILAEVSCGLGEAMTGISLSDAKVERFASRSE
ncbi:biosynthesis protein [Musa troglodytarum]|uniref:pyridoxal 5'-phosphate synthase (glutamine hydrolyzing) n=1 Tax=Musa troglodytarum TaxID=320322 RepID=A0A9E7HUF4_9LILI|nr:biosynthesis protein [Musa troglodytarum]